MGQQSNDAVLMDAQVLLSGEECARGMEQRLNYAAVKDAKINPNEEEYAGDMAQKLNTNDAAM
jgi:hypothetical protein